MIKQIMLLILFSILTACAFSLPHELLDPAEIGALMPQHTLIEEFTAFLPVLGKRMYPWVILFFLLFLFVYRTLLPRIEKKQFSCSAFFSSVLFTLYLLAGECAVAYKDLGVLFRTMPQCLFTVLKIAGFLPFFYTVVRFGFVKLDERKALSPFGKVSALIFDKKAFLLPFLIIFICWLPYVTAFFPGFVPSDGLKQLNNFFGVGNFTDHHPAFSSMLMGWAMRLGKRLGSDNLGVFLFTGPQLLITAMVMAEVFPLMRELKSPLWLRKLTLFSFACLPVWPNFAFSLLKDSLYMAMLLLFVIQLVRLIRDADSYCSRLWNFILLIACLCMMMLMRHEGQYVAVFVFLCLFTLPGPQRQWKKLLPVLLLPLCVNICFNHVIRPALDIPDAPVREALSLPIRQTSAVVVSGEEKLTEEESAILRKVFVYENIPNVYPVSLDNADELKGQFDPYVSRDDVFRYLKVWLSLGLKNPLTYLNVLLCSTERYYDPFAGPYRDIYGWFGIEQASYVNTGLFDLHYLPQTAAVRSALINLAEGLPRLPLTSLFYSSGANVWVLIFCFCSLLRKKVRGVVIPLLPGLLHFVILHNSAVNGFFRYMLPILITLPVAAAWTLRQNRNTE